MTAAYRFRGLGWFGGGVIVTLAFYLVSLQVAAERKRLEGVNATIASTERDIRALETEFDTRANLAQLERWNGDTLGLVAPQAAQFVPDEARLAAMDAVPRAPVAKGDVRMAALVVPSLSPPAAGPSAPAAATRATASAPDQTEASSAPAPMRAALRKVRVTPSSEPAMARTVAVPAAAERPTMAMLDRKLISDSAPSRVMNAARAERARDR